MELTPSPIPPRGMRRVVIVVPSAFTLANLFFGFWSIVSAFNGNYA
jgi:phosphatidylserine synthase